MVKNAKDLILDIMSEKGVTNAQLGDRMGVTNTAVWDRLNSKRTKSLKIETVQQMLHALDYTLVAIPTEKRKSIPDGGCELE